MDVPVDRASPVDDLFAEAGDPSEILGLLAGAASMCWQPRPTGEFDSSAASRFVDAALERLKEISR
jgi:hypothetical protein